MAADPDALDAFLAEPRNVIVIGYGADGRAHATPNWFLWDGGRFYISTTRGRAKYRMFSNDPRVQLVVDDSTGFRYVVLDGVVDIVEDIDTGLNYFRRLRAKHGRRESTDDDLRAEMRRDGRVTLVVSPNLPPEQWLQHEL